jgi:hypothetical protein
MFNKFSVVSCSDQHTQRHSQCLMEIDKSLPFEIARPGGPNAKGQPTAEAVGKHRVTIPSAVGAAHFRFPH